MPYTALYRKIRPQTFKEIAGQPHIVRALGNQLNSGQISHAYLFCGTRGTGKTSAAKILARAVNCLAPKDGGPCNICEMCKSILAERCIDVAEIDAASNNGVENIRDLRDEVKYLPSQGRYKVFIVDEVHMLSGAAFNALLKTLEEPPAYVIFILATTDPQKIPATILSRCQRYDFRRISAADMTATLRGYLQKENLAFEEAALDYIAYHSDGAMRDALSLLDQCLSSGENSPLHTSETSNAKPQLGEQTGLTLEKVRDLLGAVDKARLFEFADALAAGNSGEVMHMIATAMDDGRDVSQFTADLVRHFRDVLVAGFSESLDGTGEFSADSFAKLKEQSTRIHGGLLMKYINGFSDALREMRFVPHMRTAFEVTALRLCMPEIPVVPVATVVPVTTAAPVASVATATNSPAENSFAAEKPVVPVTTVATATNSSAEKPVVPAAPVAPVAPDAPDGEPIDIVANWAKFCTAKALPRSLQSMLKLCTPKLEDGVLKIFCGKGYKKQLERQKKAIREGLADYFKLSTPPHLEIEEAEAYNIVKEPPPPEVNAVNEVNEVIMQSEAPAIPDDWAAAFGQGQVSDDENPF
ncbi:MAG: DNA polymerase III subunit gamma/tau [Defluviitaleaceae bacterium]|nr:DNA polymerase III subunit gamma/tau [Defluviitaleaceae bacterium]